MLNEKGKAMDKTTDSDLMQNESIENLILISAFGNRTHRRQALNELNRRRLINCAEQAADDFMTTLSGVF
jgi:hypothetical protein